MGINLLRRPSSKALPPWWPNGSRKPAPPGVTYVQVGNSAEALGVMAANFYDNPSAKLQLVAVTGNQR